jgi:Integrase zinc binding domain
MGSSLYRGRKGLLSALVIGDKSTRTLVLTSCHNNLISGHLTVEKTLETVYQTAWWPELASDIDAYVRSHPTCQGAKRSTGKQFSLCGC